MPDHFLLQVKIDEATPPEGATGLLVPVPPTTPHQALKEARLPAAWTASPVADTTGVQQAFLVEFPSGEHGNPVFFEMVDHGDLSSDQLARREDTAGLAADVFELAERIGLLECESETRRLRKIVDVLASKFQYRSDLCNESPLTCDVLTGNCLSINDAFLKLAKVAGIPAAYYIGYFFEGGSIPSVGDRHCWVSTLTSAGFESWDVAHYLKRGIGAVQPALNPIPGFRLATSVGKNLNFQLPGADIAVPHLCEPRWILNNAIAQPCRVKVSVELATAAQAAGQGTLGTDRMQGVARA